MNYDDEIESPIEEMESNLYNPKKENKMEIENSIPLPSETKPKKSRGRKAAEGKKLNPAAGLIAALKFISIAQSKAGTAQNQFCMMIGNWAAASNGILTVAHPIQEILQAQPHTLQFIEALSQAKDDLAITQITPSALCVTSGDLRALIPCAAPQDIQITGPDANPIPVGNELQNALGLLSGIPIEGSENANYASVLLGTEHGTSVATNGSVLAEIWHGFQLPKMLIPKAAAAAVAKSPYVLQSLAFSETSVTFFFENNSFIKTQVYGEKYHNYLEKFNYDNGRHWKVPDDFYKALKAISPFSKDGNAHFTPKQMEASDIETARYNIDLFPENFGAAIKDLNLIEFAFDNISLNKEKEVCFFNKGNARGIISIFDKEATPF